MKTILLEEKVKIFREFCKTGEKLSGNTVYKGYPIGRWSIAIRNTVKRRRIKDRKRKFNCTTRNGNIRQAN